MNAFRFYLWLTYAELMGVMAIPDYLKGTAFGEFWAAEPVHCEDIDELDCLDSPTDFSNGSDDEESSDSETPHSKRRLMSRPQRRLLQSLPEGYSPVPSADLPRMLDAPGRIRVTDTTASTIERSDLAMDLSADEALVQSRQPIPHSCGVYYFEVAIKKLSRESALSIGLFDGTVAGQWSYSSDDGTVVPRSGAPRSYSSPYGPDDVVGCGISFRRSTIFFTKNGISLGDGLCDVPTDWKLYPGAVIVGLGSVEFNFGETPFLFDIENFLAAEKASVLNTAAAARDSSGIQPFINSKSDELVASYLAHMGYRNTASVFRDKCDVHVPDIGAGEDFEQQAAIGRLILSGEISEAINTLKQLFPAAITPVLDFNLRLHKYMQLARRPENLEKAILLAQQLCDEQPTNPKLYDALALLGTRNPDDDPRLQKLYSVQQLQRLCDEVNSAIRISKGLPAASSLERLVQFSLDAVRTQAPTRGEAALFNIRSDFLGPWDESKLDTLDLD